MTLVCALLYGTGMRLLEGLRLRVKDVEFERREVLVRNCKGGKDRVTVLPENLILSLQQQIAKCRALDQRDLEEGFGSVWMPTALDVKYPNAPKQWGWQWVFPSTNRSVDPRTGKTHRHHLNEASVQKAMSLDSNMKQGFSEQYARATMHRQRDRSTNIHRPSDYSRQMCKAFDCADGL